MVSFSVPSPLSFPLPAKRQNTDYTYYRGINEGRSAARDVDVFLMGRSTQLPRTGGMVQRTPLESMMKHEASRAQAVPA